MTPVRKEKIARLVKIPIIRRMMILAVRALVPRHRLGVAVVGFDEQGRILMLRHVFHPLTPWGLPGGWMAHGESPAECALRELKEETNLTAELGPVIHVTREEVPVHIGIAYVASIRPAELRLSSEIIEAGWFMPDALPSPLLPFVEQAIQGAMDAAHNFVAMEKSYYE